jgi:hypothetical protein
MVFLEVGFFSSSMYTARQRRFGAIPSYHLTATRKRWLLGEHSNKEDDERKAAMERLRCK